VADNYYEQELRYQSQIDGMRNARSETEQATVAYDPRNKEIVVSIPSPSTTVARSGMVQLYRPSSLKLDRQYELQTDSRGLQRIDAAALAPGLWKVRVSWRIQDRDYLIDQRLVIGQPS
jgi:hypothetical protein